ncbi:MAG: CvpA family protein [bacterium]|nr:CvpA family protein [bacterium]
MLSIPRLGELGWPDIVLGALLLFALLKGAKRGGISEIGGLLAIVVAIAAAILYRGQLDQSIGWMTHAASGVNHLLGILAAAVLGYVVVLLIASILNGVMRLPVLGTGNALLGAAMGAAKAAVLLWAVLYVALFFPLPQGMRGDLSRSILAGYLTLPNARIDHALESVVPAVAAPYIDPLFARHRLPHRANGSGW